MSERTRHRWGIVSAGGEGRRLQHVVKTVYGQVTSKQYCAILDGDHGVFLSVKVPPADLERSTSAFR
jgi:hypothetical protein